MNCSMPWIICYFSDITFIVELSNLYVMDRNWPAFRAKFYLIRWLEIWCSEIENIEMKILKYWMKSILITGEPFPWPVGLLENTMKYDICMFPSDFPTLNWSRLSNSIECYWIWLQRESQRSEKIVRLRSTAWYKKWIHDYFVVLGYARNTLPNKNWSELAKLKMLSSEWRLK